MVSRLLDRLMLLRSNHRAVVGRSRVGRCLHLRRRAVRDVDHRRVRAAVTGVALARCGARRLDDRTVPTAGRRCRALPAGPSTGAAGLDDRALAGRERRRVVTGSDAAGSRTAARTAGRASTAGRTSTGRNASTTERRAFLTQDVAVSTGATGGRRVGAGTSRNATRGVPRSARCGRDPTGSRGHAAGSGRDAARSAGNRAGPTGGYDDGAARLGRSGRGQGLGRRVGSCAADAEPCAGRAAGLPAYADTSDGAADLRRRGAMQRGAFAGNEPGLRGRTGTRIDCRIGTDVA